MSFLPYAKQAINKADLEAVADALQDDTITRGAKVESFEKSVAKYCGAQYAVAFNSGTAALMAAYFAAQLTPYDRVISTPNTFIATVGYPLQLGIYPDFVDLDRKTGNMDLDKLKEALNFRSSRGRAIVVPVHFGGIAIDMQKVDRLLDRHPNAIIIEDAAHAIGSYYPSGERVGSCRWSHMTMFSFHPAKTITTGEGGMVTTNDPDLYHRLQLYRNNGIEREAPYLEEKPNPGYYEVQAITGNFHVTEMQGALGLSQLQRIESFIKKRRRLVQLYREQLKDLSSITLMTDEFDDSTAFHLCVAQIDFKKIGLTRVELMNKLKDVEIGTQVHYVPLYRHPFLKKIKPEQEEFFPETEAYYERALSLPLYYHLKEEDVMRVCDELKRLAVS